MNRSPSELRRYPPSPRDPGKNEGRRTASANERKETREGKEEVERERTLSDQATSTVDSSRVELNEFEILKGKTGSDDHSVSISRAGVSGSTREVSPTVTRGGVEWERVSIVLGLKLARRKVEGVCRLTLR